MIEFSNLPIDLPAPVEENTRHAYHLFTVLIDAEKTGISRDEFLNVMNNQNIGTGVHYLAIPEHPFYKEEFGWKLDDYPNAVKTGRQTVSLPLSPKLTEADIERIISLVKKVLG